MRLGRAERFGFGWRLAIRVAELHHEIVLRAIDAQPVPEALMRQRTDVGDVLWRELRRQLDDDPPGIQFQVQGAVRIEHAPRTGRRAVENLLRATVSRIGGCG